MNTARKSVANGKPVGFRTRHGKVGRGISDQTGGGVGRQRTFVVVVRAPAAVAFERDVELQISKYASTLGPVEVVCTTRYLGTQPEVALPGDLSVEVRGPAQSLNEALEPFANAALGVLPLLALSANAAVGEAEIEFGYEDTPGVTERDYFQSYIPGERGVLRSGRRLDVPATVELVRALGRSPDQERILRAANQYRMALGSWRLGRETLSLAPLWMAVEALTKAKVRAELASRGLGEQADLAASMGVDLRELDGAVRRDLILQGDEEAYRKAKKASNGFEHGFLDYGKICKLSASVRGRVARHVRRTIFEMCGIEGTAFSTLTSDPFDKPLGDWPVVKYVRGRLLGSGDDLAAPGNAHPYLRWTYAVGPSGDGGETLREITERITPELAEGISFQAQSFEAWRAD